jgi:hypothetical protein
MICHDSFKIITGEKLGQAEVVAIMRVTLNLIFCSKEKMFEAVGENDLILNYTEDTEK